MRNIMESANPSPDYQELTSQLLADQNWASASEFLDHLESRVPRLARQLKDDATNRSLLACWSRSSNTDAGAKQPIVSERILAALASLSGESLTNNAFHAGLLHTYGYLFSNLTTSFGYKRERWVQPDIAQGFALPQDMLSPQPSQGTFLGNVTAFCQQFLPGEPILAKGTPDAIKYLPKQGLVVTRFTETITSTGNRLRKKPVTLLTQWIPFPIKPAPGNKDSAGLILYSVASGDKHLLLTLFPGGSWMLDKMKKSFDMPGVTEAIRTRYNAAIPGISNGKNTGMRQFSEITL